jgi:integrase/recombinase XerC
MTEDSDLIAGYTLDMTRRSLSPKTRTIFRAAVTSFAADHPLGEATREDIESWIDDRRNADGRPVSAKTRYWWLSTLHSFYRWATRAQHLAVDPTVDIDRPKVPKRLPRPVPSAELAEALACADHADPQMRCWLLLGCYGGLRCMEIAGLCREDVLDADGLLRVLGKGDKERMVPLHPEVLAALNALPMPARGQIFRPARGGTLRPDRVSHLICNYLHEVGSSRGAHALRHYFGTEVYQASLDLRLTQELMGHSSPATTAGYAACDVRKAVGIVGGLKV